MAKARSVDAKLARMRLLRSAAAEPETLEELRKALGDASNLVVAEAAVIAGEARLVDLTPDLTANFDRFLDNPAKSDKLCRAKIAIADALNQVDYAEEEFFWRSARYVQLEPVWGGSKDMAAPLRVACAFGLVRARARGVLPYLVELLCDPEKDARIGAAQALAYDEGEPAYLLLMLKARLGDTEPEVISECFGGMLRLKPVDATPFVSGFLRSHDLAIQEAAVLALGESRRSEAFEALKSLWENDVDSRLQETVLMALAILRLPVAIDFLLARVGDEEDAVARLAVAALALHRYDERIRERTAAAASASGRAPLLAFFKERFHVDERS